MTISLLEMKKWIQLLFKTITIREILFQIMVVIWWTAIVVLVFRWSLQIFRMATIKLSVNQRNLEIQIWETTIRNKEHFWSIITFPWRWNVVRDSNNINTNRATFYQGIIHIRRSRLLYPAPESTISTIKSHRVITGAAETTT